MKVVQCPDTHIGALGELAFRRRLAYPGNIDVQHKAEMPVSQYVNLVAGALLVAEMTKYFR